VLTQPELTTGTNAYRATTSSALVGGGRLGVPAACRRRVDVRRAGYVERTVITSDRVRLAVRDYGAAVAPDHTVVLLHGLCLTRSSWALQVRHLVRRRGNRVRIITYDHRGHGDSTGADMHTYRIDRLAADLADVLTALHVTGPLTLAGHSMGGMTALAYLGRPAADRPVEPQGLAKYFGAAPNGAAAVSASPVHTVSLTTAVCFLPGLKQYDQYQALASISANTIVISGGADITTPAEHARDLVAAIPSATHLHRPTAGHMLIEEEAQCVSNAIDRVIPMHRREPVWHVRNPGPGLSNVIAAAS